MPVVEPTRYLARCLICAICVFSPMGAFADFPEDGIETQLDDLKHLIELGHVARAERDLRAVLVSRPGDADVLNLLGYANRKLQRYDDARVFYVQALTIDPVHKGALEYMGELELELGDVEAARSLLKRLETACPAGCEELDDLNEAFAVQGL